MSWKFGCIQKLDSQHNVEISAVCIAWIFLVAQRTTVVGCVNLTELLYRT